MAVSVEQTSEGARSSHANCQHLARVGPDKKHKSLRARGTLISEPRFSTPREMRFFPREKGEMAFVEGFSLKRPFSLSRVGKIASRVENRGSLISVPLALRGVTDKPNYGHMGFEKIFQ